MVDYSPAGVAHIEQLYRQLAQQCVNRMANEFLANTGTSSVVRDMDIVRQALGDEQISYLGYSYGTEIGTAYLEAFPTACGPWCSMAPSTRPKVPVQQNIEQMAGFQTAFKRLRRGLRPLAGLPVGHRPGAVRQTGITRLVDPLVASRARRRTRAVSAMPTRRPAPSNALYTRSIGKYLTSGLLGLQRPSDAGDLLMLADDYNGPR